jgi:large subunit ribosomal protein L25
MKSEIVVTAEPRDTRGKNEARRLRARGLAPAVVYGAGTDPVALSVNPKEVNKILRGGTGSNTIFNITVNGAEAPVMIVDWQYDPIKNNLLHIDLKRIDMTQRITVKVPVTTSGVPRGVKEQGGLLELISREVEIECLPGDIPGQFVVDVANLMLGQNFRAGELQITGSAKLISPADTVIAHVVTIKGGEEAEAAAPVAGAAAPAEPEVIKKGKKEEEAAPEEKGKKK